MYGIMVLFSGPLMPHIMILVVSMTSAIQVLEIGGVVPVFKPAKRQG